MFRKKSEDIKIPDKVETVPESADVPRRTRSISSTLSKNPFRRKTVEKHDTAESTQNETKPKSLKQRISMIRNKSVSRGTDENANQKPIENVIEGVGTSSKQEIPKESIGADAKEPEVTEDLDKMIMGLVERIKLLETKLEEKQSEVVKVQNQLQHANAKNVQLKEKLQKDKDTAYETDVLKSKVEHLEQLNGKLQLERDQLEKSQSQLLKERDGYSEEAEKAEIETERLKCVITSLEEGLELSGKQNANLRQQIVELKGEQTNKPEPRAENDLVDASAVIEDYRLLVSELQDQIQLLQEEKDHQMSSLSSDQEKELNESILKMKMRLVDLSRQTAHFEWRTTFLQTLLNIAKKENFQKSVDCNKLLESVNEEKQKLKKQVQLLEERNQELHQLLNESKNVSGASVDFVLHLSAVESRLDLALIEIEQIRNHELAVHSEISKKNMEIALLATRVHDLEELRQFEFMEFQILQDELFYCKQNYTQELECMRKGSLQKTEMLEKSYHMLHPGRRTFLNSVLDEPTAAEKQNAANAGDLQGRAEDPPQFLPCVTLQQAMRASLKQCRESPNTIDENLVKLEESLNQQVQLVSALYRSTRDQLRERDRLVMEMNKSFRDCYIEVSSYGFQKEGVAHPFVDSISQLTKLTSASTKSDIFQTPEQQAIDSIMEKLERLQSHDFELSNLEQRYKRLVKDTEPLLNELSALRLHTQKLTAAYRDLENLIGQERRSFSVEIQKRDLKEQHLSKLVEDTSLSYQMIQNQLQQAKGQIESYEKEMSNLKSINASIDDFKGKITQLETELLAKSQTEKECKCKLLTEDLALLQTQKKAIQEQLVELQSNLHQKETDFTNHVKQLKSLELELQEKIAAELDLKKSLLHQEQVISNLQTSNSSLQKELDIIKVEKASLEVRRKDELQGNFTIECKCVLVQQELAILIEQKVNLENRLNTLQSTLQEKETMVLDAAKQILDLESALQSKMTTEMDLRNSLAAKENVVIGLESQITTLQKELETAKKECLELQQSVRNHEKELSCKLALLEETTSLLRMAECERESLAQQGSLLNNEISALKTLLTETNALAPQKQPIQSLSKEGDLIPFQSDANKRPSLPEEKKEPIDDIKSQEENLGSELHLNDHEQSQPTKSSPDLQPTTTLNSRYISSSFFDDFRFGIVHQHNLELMPTNDRVPNYRIDTIQRPNGYLSDFRLSNCCISHSETKGTIVVCSPNKYSSNAFLCEKTFPPSQMKRLTIDTYKLVKYLESSGFSRSQSVALMRTMNTFLVDSLLTHKQKLLSSQELENNTFSLKQQFQDIKYLLKGTLRHDFTTDVSNLNRELDSLSATLQDSVSTLKSEVLLEMNHHKQEIKDLQKQQELEIQNLSHRMVIKLAELKTLIETMKVELTTDIVWMTVMTMGGILLFDWFLKGVKEKSKANDDSEP